MFLKKSFKYYVLHVIQYEERATCNKRDRGRNLYEI